jgi:TolA-binding protein
MNPASTCLAAIVLSAGLAAPVMAQSADDGQQRYILRPAGEGFIRLDRVSGATSQCRLVTGNLVCRPAGEEGEEMQARIGELQSRVAELESQLATTQRQIAESAADVKGGKQAPPETSAPRPAPGVGQVAKLAYANFLSVVAGIRDSRTTD